VANVEAIANNKIVVFFIRILWVVLIYSYSFYIDESLDNTE
jgi:hypothetical protein